MDRLLAANYWRWMQAEGIRPSDLKTAEKVNKVIRDKMAKAKAAAEAKLAKERGEG